MQEPVCTTFQSDWIDTTGNKCANINYVGRNRRLWEWNSQLPSIASDFVCNSRGAKRLLEPALAYGTARIPLRVLQNTTAWASIPPFFSSPLIILATGRLVASYLLSSTPPVSSSTSYSSRLTRYPRRRHPHRHRTRRVLLDIHAAGILIDITLVGSYCTTSHCLCSSESCVNHVTKLVGLRATSHSRSSLPPVSSSTSDLSRLVISADLPLFLTRAERFHPHKEQHYRRSSWR